MGGLILISGAFGLFHKETVLAVGGYRTHVHGEDLDLTLRLHRHLMDLRRPIASRRCRIRCAGRKGRKTFDPWRASGSAGIEVSRNRCGSSGA